MSVTRYYCEPNDGWVMHTVVDVNALTAWNACHDALVGSDVSSTDPAGDGLEARDIPVELEWDALIHRSFFWFNTSGLKESDEIISCTFALYGNAALGASSSGCCQEGDQSQTLTTSDFRAPAGPLLSSPVGNWNDSGYNYFTFNASGLSAINKGSATKICVREYNHDYLDVIPTDHPWGWINGCKYQESSDVPYLDITISPGEATGAGDVVVDTSNVLGGGMRYI